MANGKINDRHDIYERSFKFAKELIIALQKCKSERISFVILNQVVRSGTSIGANLAEADGAQTRKDFINKVSISLKESKETAYWLELLYETGYIDQAVFRGLFTEVEELTRILGAIRSNAQKALTV